MLPDIKSLWTACRSRAAGDYGFRRLYKTHTKIEHTLIARHLFR